MNTVIGIISWFPDDKKIRKVRIARLNKLLSQLRSVCDLPIMILAQNWKGVEISVTDNITICCYGKLGITGAREELRKKFVDSPYEFMLCFDDDFEIVESKEKFDKFINTVTKCKDCFVEYENYLMNGCCISKYIANKYPFNADISAEKGTGFEDWIYVSIIKRTDNKHYVKVNGFGIIPKPRSEFVEDEYSTWQNEETNKTDITKKSIEIINRSYNKNNNEVKKALNDYLF